MVTHLQNVLCVIRTSVVLILDDMIVKDMVIRSCRSLNIYIYCTFL